MPSTEEGSGCMCPRHYHFCATVSALTRQPHGIPTKQTLGIVSKMEKNRFRDPRDGESGGPKIDLMLPDKGSPSSNLNSH